MNYLSGSGIEVLIHYPLPIHKQRAYAGFDCINGEQTIEICNEVLSLPMSEALDAEEIEFIVDTLKLYQV